MSAHHLLFVLASALLVFCTPADALVAVNTAADACQAIELVTDNASVRVVCLAVGELDRLLDALLAAQQEGRGVELALRGPDGAEERVKVRAADVEPLAARAAGARARMRAR